MIVLFVFSSSWLFIITGLQHVFCLLYSKYWLQRKTFLPFCAYRWYNRLTFALKLHSEIRDALNYCVPNKLVGILQRLCGSLVCTFTWPLCIHYSWWMDVKLNSIKPYWVITWNLWNHALYHNFIILTSFLFGSLTHGC